MNAAGDVAREACDRALSLAATQDAVVIGPGLGQDAGVRRVRARVRAPLPGAAGRGRGRAERARPSRGGPDPRRARRPELRPAHRADAASRARWRACSGLRPARCSRGAWRRARSLARGDGRGRRAEGPAHAVADPDGTGRGQPHGQPGHGDGRHGRRAGRASSGALLARGCDAWTAASAAVFVHGRAGDLAAARLRSGVAARGRRPRRDARRRCARSAARSGRADIGDHADLERRRDRGARRAAGRGASGAGRSCSSPASWARARRRSCAGWRAASASTPTRWRARRSCCSPRTPGVSASTTPTSTGWRGDGDERELGLEELPGPAGVLAVEWAERLSLTCRGGASSGSASSTRARTAGACRVEEGP